MSRHIIHTDFAQFYEAQGAYGLRYYPAKDWESRFAAQSYDIEKRIVLLSGYGVYDTSISVQYAVAVFNTENEAIAYEPPQPPATAESI